jgi:membrane-associated phospholipid phosphatase
VSIVRERQAGPGDTASVVTAGRRSWWIEAALLAGFVALTLALANGAFLGLDVAVRDWSDAHRPEPAYWVARGLNYLGQGGPLAILALAVALWRVRRSHTIRPLLPVVAGYVLAYGIAGPLKLLIHRAPPHAFTIEHPQRLFSDPHGLSYPSGHAVNAIVWYGVLALLLSGVLNARWRAALRVVPALIVCVVTTYLGFHWVTDALAGLLLGVVLVRLLYRVPWDAVALGRLTIAGWSGPAFDR